jgi:tetratricopeptide (TPR) repeat protein
MKPDYKKHAQDKIHKKPIKKIYLVSIALIVVLGFITYGNSLNGEFIRDDISLIRDNVYIKSWSKILMCFSQNIAVGSGQMWNAYRPLQMVTYMIDYSIWGLNAKGYHLTNTVLHILVALTIYFFINIVFGDRLLSLFTSMLFVANPLHTNAVSYISGRADSLSTLLMFICFIFYIKLIQRKNTGIYIVMLLSYVLALLSRENTLILPAFLLLYHYTFKKKIKMPNFVSILSISFVYILVRTVLLASSLSNITYPTTLLERIPGFFAAITNYIMLLVLPFNLHANYGTKLFSLGDPRVISGIFVAIFLLVYAFRKRGVNILVFFAICWFFIALLPQSNLYPINAYMAEHWLYLPSIGFFLTLSKGLSSLYKSKRFKNFALFIIIILLAFYLYLTIKQNKYWQEPIAFYEKTLKHSPRNTGEYINLGNAYRDIGKTEEAIAAYKKAIEIDPNYTMAYNNLGIIYRAIGKTEEAIAAYKKAIEIDPELLIAHNNLAALYDDIGKPEGAITIYNKIIGEQKTKEINPELAKIYNNLGKSYSKIGKTEEAITSLKKAIEIDPNYAKAYYNLGKAYGDSGKSEEAISAYKKAIKIEPRFIEAYYNLGNTYNAIGRKEEAIASLRKAIKIDPFNLKAYNNLGDIYMSIGKRKDAIPLFKKAIELNPKYAIAYFNLSVAYFYENKYDLAIEYADKAGRLGYKINPDFLKLLDPFRQERLR